MYNKPMLVSYSIAALIGLVFGSFAGASVWRLRARQLLGDKARGDSVDKGELKRLKPLTAHSFAHDRSRCLECSHELAWFDLLPLVSWLSTRGRCRYCHKPIGWFEPAIELATSGLFVSFYYYWNLMHTAQEWPLLIVWAAVLVLLVILFVYDAKWFLLPDVIMWPFIFLSGALATIGSITAADPASAIVSAALAVLLLSGLYLLLWFVSGGEWVGFGDVKLGLGLGLLLADWQLAFLALFFANFIGTLIVLPGLATKKLSRKTQIPFGPLLIIGFFIALYFGQVIITYTTDYTGKLLMLY